MNSFNAGERAVERVQPAFQPVHVDIGHEGRTGDGELPADIEERVLDVEKTGAHLVVERVKEDCSDAAVELVDLAQRLNAGRVLVHP